MNVAALKSAARAAIVMPAVFALADKVIAQPQTSFLAAFGSFAMLVLTEGDGLITKVHAIGDPRKLAFISNLVGAEGHVL